MIDVPSPGEPDHETDVQPIRPDVTGTPVPEAAPTSGLGTSSDRDELLPNPSIDAPAPVDVSAPIDSSEQSGSSLTAAAPVGHVPPSDAGTPAVADTTTPSGDPSPAPGMAPTAPPAATPPTSTPPPATSSPASPPPATPATVETAAPAALGVRSPELVSDVVRPLPRVMAVANQKGGVGKTTTTVNLGASLAELDYRVLVVDLDPQGNATTGLGINPRTLEYTMYDILLNDVPLDECIEPTEVKGLFVAPASLDLAGAEVELVSTLSRESRLKRALAEVIDDYDYVLIDCPPSLGLLTVNALAAATEVLVPIQCEYYALEGLGQLTRNVDLIQRNLNPDLEISAIVLVMYDARTRLGEQVATEVRAHFGSKVCRNVIPRNVRLSEAPSFGKPINTFDPSSRGAVAYRELAREVSGGS